MDFFYSLPTIKIFLLLFEGRNSSCSNYVDTHCPKVTMPITVFNSSTNFNNQTTARHRKGKLCWKTKAARKLAKHGCAVR
jgi:hypothetical protein